MAHRSVPVELFVEKVRGAVPSTLWTGMQKKNVPNIGLLVIGASLVLGACAAETSATELAPDVTTAIPEETTSPVTIAEPTPTAAVSPETPVPGPSAPVEHVSETVPTTSVPAPPPTLQPVEPADVPEANPVPVPSCGEFEPLPPLPDSMPTLTVDTNGDGMGDAVTAYGAADGWTVRVVEDGVVSESVVASIEGWAYLAEPIPDDGGVRLVLVDNDTEERFYFATGDDGCVHPTAVGLGMPTDVEIADDGDMSPCGPLPAIPADALVGDEFWFDLNDDGMDGDLLLAYQTNGVWKLRAEIETWEGGPLAQSEVEIPGAGAHGVRVVGLADVDESYGGDEVVAVVGGGASELSLGVFSFLEGGCLVRYQSEGGGVYAASVGGTIGHGSGLTCTDGLLLHTGYELAENGTYTAWSTPYQPVALITIGTVPDVDGYDEEGLTFEAASADLFDCHGLHL